MGTTIISTSNSVYNYTGSWLGYYFYLEVILNSQSIANNTSNITVNHYGQANTSTGGGYSGFTTPSSTITVQGSDKRTGECDANIPTSGTKVLLGTWTGDVAHASDGTLSLTVSASYAPNTSRYSYLPQANTLSKTVSVATIPRASAISLNVSSYTVSASSGNAFQWTITPQTNTFWNKLRWTLGNVDTSSQKGQGTSSGYFTNQELLSALPNAKSGTLTVYCYTYSDANYSNLVGTKSVSITVSVSLKPSAPTLTTIGFRNRSSGVNSNITTPTAGYTTVALTAWSHGTAYGAGSYTTYFSVNQGATLKTSSATANDTVIETNTLPSSAKQYTLTMTAYTVDSRGNQSDNSTITCIIYGYQPPVASLQAFRTSSSSSTAEDGAGTWARVLFSNSLRGQTDANGALISNNQNAVVSATCTRSGYSSGSCTSGYNYELPDTGTMTFTYTVTDRFTTSRATVTVPTASYPLDLYDDGNGHIGAGIGAVAEGGFVQLGNGLYTKGGWLLTSGIYVNDLNQITESMVYYNENTSNKPSSYGTCYTYGFDGSTTSQWYSQIAFGTNGIIYFRNSINSAGQTWSAWSSFYGAFNPQTSINYATSAGTLATPRSINGTAFNGSADIRTATSFNLDIGALSGTSAYTAFARTPNSNTSGNMSMTLLVTGAGRFGGVFQGAWLVQLSNRGSARSMHVTTLIPNSEATVTFGHYASGDYFYFGVSRPTYSGALQITVLQSIGGGGITDYYTSSTQPSGWTSVSNRDPATRTLWTGALLGGNSITLSDATRFRRFKLYAWMGATIAYEWEVDRDYITTSARKFSHGELIWIADPGGWYNTHAEVNIYSNGESIVINFANARNIRVDGTNHVVTQNNNNNYRIYRIDGIL